MNCLAVNKKDLDMHEWTHIYKGKGTICDWPWSEWTTISCDSTILSMCSKCIIHPKNCMLSAFCNCNFLKLVFWHLHLNITQITLNKRIKNHVCPVARSSSWQHKCMIWVEGRLYTTWWTARTQIDNDKKKIAYQVCLFTSDSDFPPSGTMGALIDFTSMK